MTSNFSDLPASREQSKITEDLFLHSSQWPILYTWLLTWTNVASGGGKGRRNQLKMTAIKQTIKDSVRRILFYRAFGARMRRVYKQRKEYQEWLKTGKQTPTPNLVKQMTVKAYAKRFKLHIFIETGTYLGDMIHAIQDDFDEIYSIELEQKLYKNAKEKFAGKDHITIILGDSSNVLPAVLSRVRSPCLFWLDAHWSAGITAKGPRNTPAREELHHILGHSVQGHVILIDDPRLFTGENDYPTTQELRDLIASKGGYRTLEVKDDIIRIY